MWDDIRIEGRAARSRASRNERGRVHELPLACTCGEVARWAFDPGTDFSDQLFFGDNSLPTARASLGTVKCQRCGAELNARQEMSLEASAQLAKFAPITMRVRLLGYHCPACGLDQAPPDEFTAGNLPFGTHRSSDAGKALDAAVGSIGLSPHSNAELVWASVRECHPSRSS